MKNEHKHFIARLLVGAFLLLGMGFRTSNFVTHAAGNLNCFWSETSFLNSYFRDCRDDQQDDTAITEFTFGATGNTVTAYTMGRSGYNSGSCLNGTMTVEHLTGGTSKIPLTLSGNTIYVLESGNYITTGAIGLSGDCIGVVGRGDVYVYSSGYIDHNGIFSISGKQYTIIDNLTIDGIYDGSSSGHDANDRGIVIPNSDNSTLHGVRISNNSIGLYIGNASHINVYNSSFFNNVDNGLVIQNAGVTGYITVNNSLLFQNGVGLYIVESNGNIINNNSLFNNADGGIVIEDVDATILNNITSYNNSGYGIWLNNGSTGNKYYGTVNIFGNGTNVYGTTGNDQYLTGGDAADLPGLGWLSGSISVTGTVSLANLINPKNGNDEYILPRSATGLITYGQQARTGIAPISYSYGTGIMQQAQGVIYSGTSLITGGSFNNTYFIGSSTKLTTGAVSPKGNLVSGHVYINSSSAPLAILTGNGVYPNHYNLFGEDIIDDGNEDASLTTDGFEASFSVPLGDGTGYLFAQLRSDGNRATHYMTEFILDTVPPVITGTVLPGTGVIVNNGHYTTLTGITLTFFDIHLSGATLSGSIVSGTGFTGYWSGNFNSNTTLTGEGTYVITVYDRAGNSTGKTFTIDRTKPEVTALTPITGFIRSGNNSVVFTWSGVETNLSGYTLYISGTNNSVNTGYATAATGYTVSLNNGTYNRYVLSTDKATNTGVSTGMTLIVTVPLTGTITASGTTMILSGSSYYTKDNASFALQASKPGTLFDITGGIIPTYGVSSGIVNSSTIYNQPLTTGSDGIKTLTVTFTTGVNESGSASLSVYLDTTAPSTPVLSAPASGTTITGTTAFTWSASTDTGVGLSGYRWYISSTGTFATTVLSGFTTSPTYSLVAGILGTNTTGTYYWKVTAVDQLGWTATSGYRSFYYSGILDLIPDTFTFTSKTSARLDREYRSSTGTITGLTANTYTLITINKGALYINGVYTGNSGYVDNGDTVNIEMFSSDEYDDAITSTLKVGTTTIATYKITTMEEDEDTSDEDEDGISTNLSNTEKLQIASVFLAIRDLYDNEGTRTIFFNALLESLQTSIDDLDPDDADDEKKIDALQYLYDLIENYLGDDANTDTLDSDKRYVAPNGRIYEISYNSSTKLYTSPTFMYPKTFSTLDAMKTYINVNNGGSYGGSSYSYNGGSYTVDSTRASAPYTAPNGKVYTIFRTTDGRYSSYNFISTKYFISADALKSYVYRQNR